MITKGNLVVVMNDGSVKMYENVKVNGKDVDILSVIQGETIPEIHMILLSVSMYGATKVFIVNEIFCEIEIEDEIKNRSVVVDVEYRYAAEGSCIQKCKLNLLPLSLEPMDSRPENVEYIESASFGLNLGNTTVEIDVLLDDNENPVVDRETFNLSWLWFYTIGNVEYSSKYNVDVDDVENFPNYRFSITGKKSDLELKVTDEMTEDLCWTLVDREDQILHLERWAMEADSLDRGSASQAITMRADAQKLRDMSDHYIWSSLETNKYVSPSGDKRKSDEIAKIFVSKYS